MGRALRQGAEREGDRAAEDDVLAGDETLAPLREVLAPEAFRDILALYEDTIRSAASEIAVTAGRGDLAALASAAHDLAGMCGQIGSGRATALAREIERACADSRPAAAAELAAEMAPAVAETLGALARYRDPAEA